jgi:hypothetical protein
MIVLASFFMLEPAVSRAQAVDTFEITQQITAEISFDAAVNDVVMSPTIAGGITGGTSNGATQVVVNTNNSAGYNMTIAFSSTTAMILDGGGGVINNYAPASTTNPDYTFANETFAQFGYTVVASTSADLDPSFRDNGSNACGGASVGNTANTCWFDPDDTAEVIINTTSETALSGSTSTVAFRVNVPSNPSPVVPTGFYTATATLTATVN